MGDEWSRPLPGCFTAGPGTHFIGGSVGRRTILDGCGKFGPRTFQPAASRYIDYAIKGSNNNNNNNNNNNRFYFKVIREL